MQRKKASGALDLWCLVALIAKRKETSKDQRDESRYTEQNFAKIKEDLLNEWGIYILIFECMLYPILM